MIALFDLDDTLLRGDSNHRWGELLIDLGVLDADTFLPRQRDYDEQYHAGTIAFTDYLTFTLSPLSGRSRAEIARWQQTFSARFLPAAFYADGLDRLERHRAAGHTVALVTATNRLFTEPVARFLRLDVLLASDVEMVDGVCSGRPLGEPCYAAGKLARFRRWLDETGRHDEETWFYSDSRNDIPLLEAVHHAVAVNADPVLRAHAGRAGWPLIEFRD